MKSFIEFFRARSTIRPLNLAGLAIVAGIATILLLYILDLSAANASNALSSTWLLAGFVITLLVSLLSERHLFAVTAADMQEVLHRYRMKQVEHIRRCDLDTIEKIGPARIFGALTRQTNAISTAGSAIVIGAQAAVLTIFTLVYLAWIGISAFVLALAIIAIGALLYLSRMNQARQKLAEANLGENDMFDSIGDLLGGFKEVQLNRDRSTDLAAFITAISRQVGDLTIEVDTRFTELFIFSQLTIFGACAAMVFLLPGLGFVQPEDLLRTVTVMLFLMSPIAAMTIAAQSITAAGASCDVLTELERELAAVEQRAVTAGEPSAAFGTIELHSAIYRHAEKGGDGFQVGPVDLVIRRGEVLFISGGNGSGKSTLLKMLTALYMPQAGALLMDGRLVDSERREKYQSLFSAVFSDFHLFEQPFGFDDLSEEEVSAWLKIMEIADKAVYRNGQFETMNLSTGQRKRLALVVALLEDRPILVLDEFAADQDPAFRQTFYNQILPKLHKQGKTILAVTHDERYFGHATNHLRMDAGRFADQPTAS